MDGSGRFTINLRGNPLLEAAHEIACEGHAGQTRDDGSTPYIKHPELGEWLLERLGGDDFEKAVMLLHDVLENAPQYCSIERIEDRVTKLRQELIRRMETKIAAQLGPQGQRSRSKRLQNIRILAREVAEGVGQLTDPERSDMRDGKRAYQADHIRRLEVKLQRVKILEQEASVLGDILFLLGHPEGAPFSTDKKVQFLGKVTDLAKASRTRRAWPSQALKIELLYSFHSKAERFLHRLLNPDTAAEARKDGFDIEALITETLRLRPSLKSELSRVRQQEGKGTSNCFSRIQDDLDNGAIASPVLKDALERGIPLTEGVCHLAGPFTGMVSRYTMIVSKKEGAAALSNALQARLEQQGVQVSTGAIHSVGNRRSPGRDVLGEARLFEIEPAMPLKRFAYIAHSVGAIDAAFMRILEKIARQEPTEGRNP